MDGKMQNALVTSLKDFRFISEDELLFVHIFEQENYVYMVPPIIYPSNDQKPAISETVIATMKTLWSKVDNNDVKSVNFESLYDKKHGIEGLFTSSFAEYLIKFSPCDLFVVRPK
jgi:hypothetical protein